MAVFTCAAVLAAAIAGGVVALLGAVIGGALLPVRVGVAVTVLAYAILETLGQETKVPSSCWLVPQSWVMRGRYSGAFVFGTILGVGCFTVIPFVGYYVLAAFCFLSGAVRTGTAIGGAFGLTRSIAMIGFIWTAMARRGPGRSVGTLLTPQSLIDAYQRGRWFRVTTLAAAAGALFSGAWKA
jgi:hypothetical protein